MHRDPLRVHLSSKSEGVAVSVKRVEDDDDEEEVEEEEEDVWRKVW